MLIENLKLLLRATVFNTRKVMAIDTSVDVREMTFLLSTEDTQALRQTVLVEIEKAEPQAFFGVLATSRNIEWEDLLYTGYTLLLGCSDKEIAKAAAKKIGETYREYLSEQAVRERCHPAIDARKKYFKEENESFGNVLKALIADPKSKTDEKQVADEKSSSAATVAKFDPKVFRQTVFNCYWEAEKIFGKQFVFNLFDSDRAELASKNKADEDILRQQVEKASAKELCDVLSQICVTRNDEKVFVHAMILGSCSYDIAIAVLKKSESELRNYFEKNKKACDEYLKVFNKGSVHPVLEKLNLKEIISLLNKQDEYSKKRLKELLEKPPTSPAPAAVTMSGTPAASTPSSSDIKTEAKEYKKFDAAQFKQRVAKVTLDEKRIQKDEELEKDQRPDKSQSQNTWRQHFDRNQMTYRIIFGVLVGCFFLAVCFSPLGPLMFAGAPAMLSAIAWVNAGTVGDGVAGMLAVFAVIIGMELDHIVGASLWIVSAFSKVLFSHLAKATMWIVKECWDAIKNVKGFASGFVGFFALIGGIITIVPAAVMVGATLLAEKARYLSWVIPGDWIPRSKAECDLSKTTPTACTSPSFYEEYKKIKSIPTAVYNVMSAYAEQATDSRYNPQNPGAVRPAPSR